MDKFLRAGDMVYVNSGDRSGEIGTVSVIVNAMEIYLKLTSESGLHRLSSDDVEFVMGFDGLRYPLTTKGWTCLFPEEQAELVTMAIQDTDSMSDDFNQYMETLDGKELLSKVINQSEYLLKIGADIIPENVFSSVLWNNKLAKNEFNFTNEYAEQIFNLVAALFTNLQPYFLKEKAAA